MSVFLLFFFFVAIAWVYLDFPSILIIFMCLILDLATMSLAYDKVIPSPKPNRWNLRKLIVIATVMGLVSGALNLIFLGFLTSNTGGLGTLQRGTSTRCQIGNTHHGDAGCLPDFVSGGACAGFVNPSMSNPTALANLAAWYIQLYPLCAVQCGTTPPPPHGCVSSAFLAYLSIEHSTYNTTYPYYQKTVPDDYDFSQHPWKLSDTPYTSAVINTIMFLCLCLTCNFAVFSCRTEDAFFKRRPGYVLLTIISSEMLISSLVAALIRTYDFWDVQVDEENIRLSGIDGGYVLAAWLFALVLFLLMEGSKMATYRLYNLANHKKVMAEKRRRQMEETRRRLTLSQQHSTERRATMDRAHGAGAASAGGHGGHGVTQPTQRKATWDKPAAKNQGLKQPLLDGGAGDSEL